MGKTPHPTPHTPHPAPTKNFFSSPHLGGLLGESERKNLPQMANNAVGVVYNRLHHFILSWCFVPIHLSCGIS